MNTQQFLQFPMALARRFFGQLDMFASPPTLRAKQQDKSSSLCTGFISLVLVIFFSYVFISSAIEVITYQKIDSVQTQQKLGSEEVKADNIFFAIRVGYLTLQDSRKYFDMGFFVKGEDGSNNTYSLQQCTPQQWKKIGDTYLQQFEKFQLHQFLCNRPQDSVSIKKVYYAPNSQYAVIYIRPCGDRLPTCQTPQRQRQFIYQLNDVQGAIFVQLYLLDQSISPNQKQPINYVTNSDPEFTFTTKRGIVATVQFSSYTIKTDASMFPVEDIETRQGNFLHSYRQAGTEINYPDDNFALIYFSMNRKHILLQRKVGKLDDMLSYAGGLFSIILGFLAIFLSSFNKYRYQLMVAQGIFHQDQNGNAIKQHELSFLLYIKYTIFDWISTIFCYKLNWEDCLIIDSTRDEANKQMDVSRLFRKIQSMQIAIDYLINKKAIKNCLNLLKPHTLTQIIRDRLVLQYYNKIIKGKSSLTFSQYKICKTILKLGISLTKNQQKQSIKKYNFNQTSVVSNSHMIQCYQDPKQIQINYQHLKNNQYLKQIIQQNFKQQVRQVEEVILKENQKQVQLQIAQELFEMKQQDRLKIIESIPIKILYKLVKVWLAFKSQKESSNLQTKIQTKNTTRGRKKKKLPPLEVEFGEKEQNSST